jgi:hypothetical protein
MGGHPLTDHELRVKLFQEETSEESGDSPSAESQSGYQSLIVKEDEDR